MKRYFFAGLLVLVAVLIVTFPARVAYRWLAPPEVQLSGISGSVWNGTATQALAAGAYIRNLSWRLKPSELLAGKLAFNTTSSPASGTLTTDVAVSLDGSLTFSDLAGRISLDLVHPAFQKNGISGDLSLMFSELVLQEGIPVAANGQITVANFFVPTLSAGRLGDFRANFVTTQEGVVGSVEDLSGVLEVDGTIRIASDRSYTLVGEVAARRDAPPSIEQQLRFLGTPDERGMRPFRFDGQL